MNMNNHSLISASLVLVLGLLAGCGTETGAEAGASDTGLAARPGTASEQREVVLSVPDMNCPMCPISVRKALAGVDGVVEVDASLEGKRARVLFDPARTDAEALIAAVAETGFSATLQESGDE